MIAKIDDRDAYADAIEHTVGIWQMCVIAGRRERFLELLERGVAVRKATELLYVEAFGAKPFVPWPDMISTPSIASIVDD